MKLLLPLAASISLTTGGLAADTNHVPSSPKEIKHLNIEELRKLEATEHRVEAGFLFKFAEFVDWPSNAFQKEDSPLVIGVLGLDPFGGFLDETVRDELVRGRPIVIERYRKVEEIKICHILYIGDSETARLDKIATALKGKPILTVSEVGGPGGNGPVIRLVSDQNKIHLRINNAAAHAAELSISSKLLRAADVSPPAMKQ